MLFTIFISCKPNFLEGKQKYVRTKSIRFAKNQTPNNNQFIDPEKYTMPV